MEHMGAYQQKQKRKSWMVPIHNDKEDEPPYLIKRHRYLSFDVNKETLIDEADEYYEVRRISCLERIISYICCEDNEL